MTLIAHLDGRYVPQADARIPANDVGLLYGLGSFETVRIYTGRAFLADRHQTRLQRALAELELDVPPFDLADILETLSRRNEMPNARGRVVLTGGIEAPDGSTPHPCLYAEIGALPSWAAPDPDEPVDPARAVGVHLVSNLLGGVQPVHGLKTLNYLPNYLARREARKAGAHEAILQSREGELLEGATSNFFLVVGGTIVTPPTEGRALPGVTRGVVMEEAQRLGIDVREERVVPHDLEHTDEAFLTSTLREVLPIARFGPHPMKAPGPITARLAEAYRTRVREFLARAG
jgi:branched-subunit amino acid aminotransferase/4-amino-4-deoxychorismate lyase